MRTRGYTIIELVISMAILAVIMAAVGTIFVTSLKNYRTESQKSVFQRELNFVIDNIVKDTKQATAVPENYDTFSLSQTVYILALPATNSSGDFLYNGGVFEKDYLVYYLSGNELKIKTYANANGQRDDGEETLLKNASAVNFTYSPGLTNAGQITISITESVDVGRTVTLTERRMANLRNKE
jgi:prepilin-type N-terminal cleavage/methylation domain-containing protein